MVLRVSSVFKGGWSEGLWRIPNWHNGSWLSEEKARCSVRLSIYFAKAERHRSCGNSYFWKIKVDEAFESVFTNLQAKYA
jgi:hypothetical protein